MLIGIMSDSHGRHLAVRRAVEAFDARNVHHIIHCGDVGGMHVFDELTGKSCHFVWGNCDFPDAALFAYLRTVGIPIPDATPLRLTLAGRRFAVLHGHEPQAAALHRIPDADYILHGHSHLPRDERINTTRIINPGALHRARRKTVAILDTQTDALDTIEISA